MLELTLDQYHRLLLETNTKLPFLQHINLKILEAGPERVSSGELSFLIHMLNGDPVQVIKKKINNFDEIKDSLIQKQLIEEDEKKTLWFKSDFLKHNFYQDEEVIEAKTAEPASPMLVSAEILTSVQQELGCISEQLQAIATIYNKNSNTASDYEQLQKLLQGMNNLEATQLEREIHDVDKRNKMEDGFDPQLQNRKYRNKVAASVSRMKTKLAKEALAKILETVGEQLNGLQQSISSELKNKAPQPLIENIQANYNLLHSSSAVFFNQADRDRDQEPHNAIGTEFSPANENSKR